MFYITFHKATSNVWAYDDTGAQTATQLLATPPAPTQLDELRCITFGPNGYLYVANGYKGASQVLVYTGSGGTDGSYDFIGVYANPQVSAGIAHPFSIGFDSNNNGYVSSQDTNVVTALSPPAKSLPCDSQPPPPAYPVATPLPVASFLKDNYPGTFLPGTFVASSVGALNKVSPAPPNVPTPQGLAVDMKGGRVTHSVRDVVVTDNGLLWVADEPGDIVKSYSLVNGFFFTHIPLGGGKSPTHLLVHRGALYISVSDSILAYDLSSFKLTTFLSGLATPAGMVFDGTENFYFADRKGQAIYRSAYNATTKSYGPPAVFIPKYQAKLAPNGLRDNPEFLLYLPG